MNGRLYKSRRDRMIGGVAGGLAAYLNIDPTLVRIVWAVLVFTTGGLFGLIYIVMWVVVPEAPRGYEGEAWTGEGPMPPEGEPRPVGPRPRSGDSRLILGGILIVLGLFFLLRSYIPEIAWDRFWPILLVAAGVALLIASLRRDRPA